MIVPTMSESEIQKILLSEISEVLFFTNKKDKDFRRKVLKSAVFPVYAHSFFKSKSGNNWIVFFEAQTKKEIGEDARITMICLLNTIIGYQVIMISYMSGKPHLILYSPHFFSRYKERMNIDKTGIDLIVEYFRYNYSYAFDKREENICGSSKHGVAMGFESEHNNICFKTFVTYEMLRDDQHVFLYKELLRQKIHEI